MLAQNLPTPTPTPNPSPQGGGEFAEFAAPLCVDFNDMRARIAAMKPKAAGMAALRFRHDLMQGAAGEAAFRQVGIKGGKA